jgi:predicted glutamine amidotransferase
MCRILCVHKPAPFSIADSIRAFARVAESSREYQGHGWGYSYWADGRWHHYHDIRPIWEDPITHKASANLLLVHARSAFRDEGIVVENNMPFHDDERIFVFNGELRGVRIKADGRIGAEKIFNFVKRFDKGDMHEALSRGVDVLHKRSRYVRAMNIIMASSQQVHVSSSFGEDPDYFQMCYRHTDEELTVCSDPLDDGPDWQEFPNAHTQSFERWLS